MNLKDVTPGLSAKIVNGDTESILAGLLRSILYNSTIIQSTPHPEEKNLKVNALFEYALSRYIRRTFSLSNIKEVSSLKTKIKNDITSTTISWKSFITALEILSITQMAIRITILDIDGLETHHDYLADLSKSEMVLAGLFKQICTDRKIGATRLDQLLDRYVKVQRQNVSAKEIASVRGNLKKEISKDNITWKIFIKCLVLLGAIRFKFSVAISTGPNLPAWAAETFVDISNTNIGKLDTQKDPNELSVQGICGGSSNDV